MAGQPPLDFPGKNSGVDCQVLLQGIVLIQGSNSRLLCLLHWQVGSLPLVPPVKPTVQGKHDFYMHWESKKFVTCFIAILTLLYSLEPNVQYLQGLPILKRNENIPA